MDWLWALPDAGIDLRKLEAELVRQALERTRGNQVRAARLLGLTRYEIRSRMKRHGINVRNARTPFPTPAPLPSDLRRSATEPSPSSEEGSSE